MCYYRLISVNHGRVSDIERLSAIASGTSHRGNDTQGIEMKQDRFTQGKRESQRKQRGTSVGQFQKILYFSSSLDPSRNAFDCVCRLYLPHKWTREIRGGKGEKKKGLTGNFHAHFLRARDPPHTQTKKSLPRIINLFFLSFSDRPHVN